MKKNLLMSFLIAAFVFAGIAVKAQSQCDDMEQGVGKPCATPKTYTGVQVATPMKIDGAVDDWAAITSNDLKNVSSGPDKISSPADLSASFKACFDATNFYILLTLTDDIDLSWPLGSDKATYQYDNVEIFFNTDFTNDDAAGAYSTTAASDAKQLRYIRGNVDDMDGAGVKWLNGGAETTWSVENTPTGWQVEASLAWAAILPDPAVIPEVIGFEISLGDADDEANTAGPRESIITWANDTGADNSWKDTRCFGYMKLVASTPSTGGDQCADLEQGATKPCATAITYTAKKGTPTIDGEATEWGTLSVDVKNISSGADKISSAADLSGKMGLVWDAAKLYVLVQVTDDIELNWPLASDKATYQYDNIEFYINPDFANDDAAGAYSGDAKQLRINRGNDADMIGVGGNWINGGAEVTFIQANTSNGWNVEVGFDWAAMLGPDITPAVGSVFGWEISVADADDEANTAGPRESIITWANDTGADNSWRDTRCFGHLKLSGDDAGMKPGAVNDITTNAVQCFPNPASDVLNITNVSDFSTITISNVVGQTVMTVDVNASNLEVSTAKFKSGMYILTFEGKNGLKTIQKVMIK